MTTYSHTWPADMQRVLIIMPQLLGDLVLATALITALKARAPRCAIDVLAHPRSAGILDSHPYIDRLFILDATWRRKGLWRTLSPRLRLLRALRQRPYDLLIQSPHTTDGSWGPALITLLGIPRAVGAHASAHGSPVKRFFWKHTFTHMLPRPHPRQGPRHTAELHLDLLRRIGIHPQPDERGACIMPNAAAEARADRLLRELALQTKGFVLFAPTAGGASKSLDRAMARALADRLADKGERLVVTAAPNPAEEDYVRELARGLPGVYNLAGALSLPELAALARRAECFIGTDSGTMHVAAAMGTPVIACFGPGDDILFGPWQTAARIIAMPWPCRPCYADGCGDGGMSDCLAALSPEAVLSALADIRRIRSIA
ncbi:MAG: putative lipopolysaccharide heptosyltransferase III [Gammaproteobacteria bacterium]|nr:putative lipopolysaccharide heptosyltransferase III [Gammaproteobacteria bacterium]